LFSKTFSWLIGGARSTETARATSLLGEKEKTHIYDIGQLVEHRSDLRELKMIQVKVDRNLSSCEVDRMNKGSHYIAEATAEDLFATRRKREGGEGTKSVGVGRMRWTFTSGRTRLSHHIAISSITELGGSASKKLEKRLGFLDGSKMIRHNRGRIRL
jgi:hypothetical protein